MSKYTRLSGSFVGVTDKVQGGGAALMPWDVVTGRLTDAELEQIYGKEELTTALATVEQCQSPTKILPLFCAGYRYRRFLET